MHYTAMPYKLQQKPSPFFARGRPWSRAFSGNARDRARMHQRLYASCDKTVYDKEILFDSELWVQPFEIAGTVTFNAMTQYQILSASGCTDWISLNKAESVESAVQCRGLEETAGDRKAAQIIQCNQHDLSFAKIFARPGRAR
jgi:hypothetical protein